MSLQTGLSFEQAPPFSLPLRFFSHCPRCSCWLPQVDRAGAGILVLALDAAGVGSPTR